jgi:hypothetical protein
LKEHVFFESGSYAQDDCPDAYEWEADALNDVLNEIKSKYEPCVLVGTVGRWNGTFNGYKYCHDFNGFRDAISGYDIIIRQKGTRLHFTLIHHDGRHEMELRRLNDYGYNNRDRASFDYFIESTMKFINKHTNNFGKIK